jgi:hypothetical protein
MHQNVRKNGVVIVSNIAESETYPLPGKSPTFYITNQFCRVRLIECLLYCITTDQETFINYVTNFFQDSRRGKRIIKLQENCIFDGKCK